MAEKSRIYRATINLSDIDREVYTEQTLTLACHPSETTERLVARIIAYCLCYEETLEFTKGICEGDSPDIWLRDIDQHIEHWIEVGLPTPERIQEASRRAKQVTFFLYGQHLNRWQQMHLEKLSPLTNLQLFSIPSDFLSSLVVGVSRKMEWSITQTEGMLYLNDGKEDFMTSIEPIDHT
ncbi:MAG: YaeQ family protein [Sedimenticola sp.]|nr:YaeQ family protein [Sedimenticola sp.]